MSRVSSHGKRHVKCNNVHRAASDCKRYTNCNIVRLALSDGKLKDIQNSAHQVYSKCG